MLIDFSIMPVDMTHVLSDHTRYLSQIQAINRKWNRDDDDFETQDYSASGKAGWPRHRKQELKPLYRPDPLADDILRLQQRFHQTLHQPHLKFHINTLAKTLPTAKLIASIVAESAFEDGVYQVLPVCSTNGSYKALTGCLKDSMIFSVTEHDPIFATENYASYPKLKKLLQVATVDELCGAIRLPTASIKSPRCIRKDTDPFIQDKDKIVQLGTDFEIPNATRGPLLTHMCKHGFVTGTTGSSKTNTGLNLMLQLARHGTPVLVIEPVKTGYRRLKALKKSLKSELRKLGKSLQIYTPGDEKTSPLRFNPLELLPHITQNEHIDNILPCLMAAMPISGPLPALLHESLEHMYDTYGGRSKSPTMKDLVKAIKNVSENKGYSADTRSDITTALEVRFGPFIRGNLGKIFESDHSIPDIDNLISGYTVIELDRLAEEPASLFILCLLTLIRESLKKSPHKGDLPRCVIIIEEAHKIVGRSSDAQYSPDIATPKDFATKMFANMLAEIRALGIGIVFFDQIPTKMAPEVIKNTCWKIALNQTHDEEREAIGSAILLNELEKEELARLKPGEGFFFTEGYYKARKIKTPYFDDEYNIRLSNHDANFMSFIAAESWRNESILRIASQELALLKKKMDAFDDDRIQAMEKLKLFLKRQARVLNTNQSEEKNNSLTSLKKDVFLLKQQFMMQYQLLKKKGYAYHMESLDQWEIDAPEVLKFKHQLTEHYSTVIKPNVTEVLRVMDQLMNRCDQNS